MPGCDVLHYENDLSPCIFGYNIYRESVCYSGQNNVLISSINEMILSIQLDISMVFSDV